MAVELIQEKDKTLLFDLKEAVTYAATNSPFYRKHIEQSGINPYLIESLADFQQIPPTTKDDLQQYNWDFLCVERSEVAEYCSTSGTLGSPVTIALTEKDLSRLAINEFNSFQSASCTDSDVFQLLLTLDRQFMAGVAYYSGIRKLGASAIRTGPGGIAMQWETINRLQPTVLIAVPSFIVGMLQYAKEKNIDPNTSSVRKIICIGENIRIEDLTLNKIGQRIVDQWNIKLFSTYASTEMQTAFTECMHGKGGHHQPELLHFEILDEENKVVGPGQYGELVITTLGVEGMPLLRYKTGDICCYYDQVCSCGNKNARISPVLGRKQQLIKYKGTTLYPQAIFNVLNGMDGVEEYAVEVFTGDLGTDDLVIHLTVNDLREWKEEKLLHHLQSALRVTPKLNYKPLSELLRMQVSESKRKPTKFIDNRKV